MSEKVETETTETTATTETKKPRAKSTSETKDKGEKGEKGAKKTEEVPSKKAAGSSENLGDLLGYAKIFADWEPIPCDTGVREFNPKQIYNIFDVRATAHDPSVTFLASTEDGIKSPPCVTMMRYLGETQGALKKGQDYAVTVFGRVRLRAALHHKMTDVACTVRQYKSWQDMVADAWEENYNREATTTWDVAYLCKQYRDSGLTPEQIAAKMGVKASYVTQHLSIHTLSDGAKTAIRQGKFGITVARALRGLPEQQQDAFTARALDKEWDANRLCEEVKNWRAKNDDGSPTARAPKARTPRVTDYASATLKPRPVAGARTLLAFYRTKEKQLRSDGADADKIKLNEGIRIGLEYAYQLREPPKSALVEPDEAEEEEAEDSE